MFGFLSVDPLTSSYPMLTPYQFAGNTPIRAIDLDGLEPYPIAGTDISNSSIPDFSEAAVGKRMSAQEIAYRQNFRRALSMGYNGAEANKYSQLVQGSDPIARYLQGANTRLPNLLGDVSFPNANGLDDFAGNIAAGSAYAMGAALVAPLVSGLGTVGGGGQIANYASTLGATGYEFGSGADLAIRGTSFASNLWQQTMNNAATGGNYNLVEGFASAALPLNFFEKGLASSVGLYQSEAPIPGQSAAVFETDFDITRGLLNGAANQVGSKFPTLFGGGTASQIFASEAAQLSVSSAATAVGSSLDDKN